MAKTTKPLTTIATLTDEQVTELRREAAEAGDLEMVKICDRALKGHPAAWGVCAKVIADAEAQDDSPQKGE